MHTLVGPLGSKLLGFKITSKFMQEKFLVFRIRLGTFSSLFS